MMKGRPRALARVRIRCHGGERTREAAQNGFRKSTKKTTSALPANGPHRSKASEGNPSAPVEPKRGAAHYSGAKPVKKHLEMAIFLGFS